MSQFSEFVDAVKGMRFEALPERPEGWPADWPEPVLLKGEKASGVPTFRDENGTDYLLFHDPQAPGGFMVMDTVSSYNLFHGEADVIRRQIFQDGINPVTGEALPADSDDPKVAELDRQIDAYSRLLNQRLMVDADVSLSEIEESGWRQHEPVELPEVQVEAPPVRAQFNEVRNSEQELSAPVVPSWDAFFEQKIKGDYDLTDLSGNPGVKHQLPTILSKMERYFQNPDSQEAQEKIAYFFGNVPEELKPLVADYIEKRIETGGPVDFQPYRDAVAAQIDGDVSKAQQILAGTYQPPAPAPEPADTEPDAAQVAQQTYRGIESDLQVAIKGFERAENRGAEKDPGSAPSGISQEDWERFSRAAEVRAGYVVSIKRGLGALQETFSGQSVVEGDLAGDMDKIQIHTENLPPGALDVLGDELQKIRRILDDFQQVKADYEAQGIIKWTPAGP